MKFETPAIEVVKFDVTDVITASAPSQGGGAGGTWELEED